MIADDPRWMAAALALAARGRGRTAPNPNVGCVLVKDGRVVGRGWTQPGGRPHAEAMALSQAGDAAPGGTSYVTLEPCAHASPRGPACADLLIQAGVARVVAAMRDPDPRTDGDGLARLTAAGVAVASGLLAAEARRSMAGSLTRRALGRPFVTLKLAMSLDGCIALASGESRWITGPEARAHVHLERSRHEAILVGRGTWEVDRPALDVRLGGLERRSPTRVILSSGPGQHLVTPGSTRGRASSSEGQGSGTPAQGRGDAIVWLAAPEQIASLPGDHLLVEGGAETAAAFLRADLVDRLLLYRAPILIGGGRASLAELGMTTLTEAHGRWQLHDARQLGADRLEVYERTRCSPGIVSDIGRIERIEQRGDTRVVVSTTYDTATIDLGASISCSGVCLTVVDKSAPGAPGWFALDVSGETLSRTAQGQWSEGKRLNLERALKLGDELGGHIVTGHVDGVAEVLGVCPEGDSKRIGFRLPRELAPFVAPKGSITVDGVSLTVNEVRDVEGEGTHFSVNVIPHTRTETTLGEIEAGQAVNIEIDVLARYLMRMESYRAKAG